MLADIIEHTADLFGYSQPDKTNWLVDQHVGPYSRCPQDKWMEQTSTQVGETTAEISLEVWLSEF